MKNFIFGILILFIGCVSVDTYNTDLNKIKSERDKLKEENLNLKVDLSLSKGALQQFGAQIKDLENRLAIQLQNGTMHLKQYDDRIVISVDNDICFESGSAKINQQALDFLNQIGTNLSIYTDNIIFIEGNTDNVPIIPNSWIKDNWELSSQRAISVIRILEKSIDPKRLKLVGNSEYNPLLENDSEENKGKNRRVDIIIIPR